MMSELATGPAVSVSGIEGCGGLRGLAAGAGAGRVRAMAGSEGLLVGLEGCGGEAGRSEYLRLPVGVGFKGCDLRGQQVVVDAVAEENQ